MTQNAVKTKRMQDREYATRFLAFTQLDYRTEYLCDIDSYLIKAMKLVNTYNDIEITKIEENFERIMVRFLESMHFGDIMRTGAGGVQLIVETHSDHILNGVRLAVKKRAVAKEEVELSFFYKDEKDDYSHKCVHPHIMQDGRLDCWPEGFFDEWDKALYELI